VTLADYKGTLASCTGMMHDVIDLCRESQDRHGVRLESIRRRSRLGRGDAHHCLHLGRESGQGSLDPGGIGGVFPSYYIVQRLIDITQHGASWADIAANVVIMVA